MKKVVMLLSLLVLFAMPSAHAAKGGGFWVTKEEFHPVDEYETMTLEDTYVELSYFTETTYIFNLLGAWMKNKGYALVIKGGADDGMYYDFNNDTKSYLVATDQIPADFPEESSLPLLIWFKGLLFWPIIAVLIIAGQLKKRFFE